MTSPRRSFAFPPLRPATWRAGGEALPKTRPAALLIQRAAGERTAPQEPLSTRRVSTAWAVAGGPVASFAMGLPLDRPFLCMAEKTASDAAAIHRRSVDLLRDAQATLRLHAKQRVTAGVQEHEKVFRESERHVFA